MSVFSKRLIRDSLVFIVSISVCVVAGLMAVAQVTNSLPVLTPTSTGTPPGIAIAIGVTVVATPTPLPTATPTATTTPSPTYTPTPTPTFTPEPTFTPTPIPVSPTPTSRPTGLIFDAPNLMKRHVIAVEWVLGASTEVTPFEPGEASGYSGKGEWRTYQVGKYNSLLTFDGAGILREFFLFEGLANENYSVDDWSLLLPRFNLPVSAPVHQHPGVVSWDNLGSYRVLIYGASGQSTPAAFILIGEPTLAAAPIPAQVAPAAPGYPQGATALCADGTYSYSQTRRGTCSYHGGVAVWY